MSPLFNIATPISSFSLWKMFDDESDISSENCLTFVWFEFLDANDQQQQQQHQQQSQRRANLRDSFSR